MDEQGNGLDAVRASGVTMEEFGRRIAECGRLAGISLAGLVSPLAVKLALQEQERQAAEAKLRESGETAGAPSGEVDHAIAGLSAAYDFQRSMAELQHAEGITLAEVRAAFERHG